ncbi:MAG: hypothetical protein K6V97_03375 [Actinomycetia bacterium]|nr:hypothetical protein [Actinomycetes bacterium]
MSSSLQYCFCGCGQHPNTCSKFSEGFRTVARFTWQVPARGLALSRQNIFARVVSSSNLGYEITSGTSYVGFQQPDPLQPTQIRLHRLHPLTPDHSNLAKNIPDNAFWYPRPLSDMPTPNADLDRVSKKDVTGLIKAFSETLQPVRSYARRRDNIHSVVTRFLDEFPDGQVDLLIKEPTALKRLAIFRVLAHLSLFDANTVEQNLQNPTAARSPFLATMAQTSALPIETVLQQRVKRGFLIDWVDLSLIFWLGPSETLPDPTGYSAVLSPWAGPKKATFDLELNLPLYRQLLAWIVGATNDLFRFLMDGTRLASQPDPGNQWLYDFLVWQEINNLVHTLMGSPDPFVRLELFLRLAYNIASRKGGQGSSCHIRDLPFEPTSKQLKALFFQRPMPNDLRNHLWNKWQNLATETIGQVLDEVLPSFIDGPGDVVRIEGRNLSRAKYVAHWVEALRHSTHGFSSKRTNKIILFTHTGRLSDELPYLAFFWWLAILAKPEWLFV